MTENKFWEIIEASRKGAEDSQAKQKAALRELLTPLAVTEVASFNKIFDQMVFNANSWDLWGAFYIINGGCSDDGFEYCRRGLVAAGRKKFEDALRDPESLGDWTEPDAMDFEDIKYVVYDVYAAKTGSKALPTHDLKQPDLQGEEWNEDGDDLEERFPKLWEKFGA